jgi:hypothetical protein
MTDQPADTEQGEFGPASATSWPPRGAALIAWPIKPTQLKSIV